MPLNYNRTDIGWSPGVYAARYYELHFAAGMKCQNGAKILADGMNNYSIQISLESGGVYCIDG